MSKCHSTSQHFDKSWQQTALAIMTGAHNLIFRPRWSWTGLTWEGHLWKVPWPRDASLFSSTSVFTPHTDTDTKIWACKRIRYSQLSYQGWFYQWRPFSEILRYFRFPWVPGRWWKLSFLCDHCSCLSSSSHAHGLLREIDPPLFRVYLRLSGGTPIFGFRRRGTHQVCSADAVLDLRSTAFDFKVCILTPVFSISHFIQREDQIRIQRQTSQNRV
jgi:hypothetical protein